MRTALPALALASGILIYAQHGVAADDPVRRWVSPNRQFTISSVAGHRADDLPPYELSLLRPDGKPVLIDEYYRAVDVLWSPDSGHVAVTDWIGSNVADCLVVDPRRPESPVSITAAVPKLDVDLKNSHSYVSCGNWLSPRTIAVRVSGHTDYPPYSEFDYRFVYDAETGRLTAP